MVFMQVTEDGSHSMGTQRAPVVVAPARGVALFFGSFTLLNLLAWHAHGADANLWWIDLRALPLWGVQALMAIAAVLLLCFALGLRFTAWWRTVTIAVLAVLGIAAAINAISYYRLLARGEIHSAIPIPVSAAVLLALLLIGVGVGYTRNRPLGRKGYVLLIAASLACGLLFPLAQIYLFGGTDYQRPADVIVVLGAQAYANGTPSPALADRIETAVLLYQRHLAPRIIMSGGPAPGGMHETVCMRNEAIRLGVPAQAIICDRNGLDTLLTVRNTIAMFSRMHVRRVLAVSHFFHLARIKLTYQRAGWDVYTVPTAQDSLGDTEPFVVCREVAALWLYYLRDSW